jgi:large subunit ribosomal protein L35
MKLKQKTHSGAKDRFKLTSKGKVKRRSAFSSHLLGGKSQDRIRNFRKDQNVAAGDEKNVKKMLGKK